MAGLFAIAACGSLLGIYKIFQKKRKTIEPRYDGLMGMPWAKRLPQAYVVYPPSENCPVETASVNMPIGNARDYAKMFGGRVVPLVDKRHISRAA